MYCIITEVPNAITYPTDASGWTATAYGTTAVGVGATSYTTNLAQSAYADITGEPFTTGKSFRQKNNQNLKNNLSKHILKYYYFSLYSNF